mmetsp:Transcript_6256/g.17661  ORF Transcript_6256/g.17661 Transcript_6256/m.17661 type:complete len:330 (-) Transcript_6256:308-1297(-)
MVHQQRPALVGRLPQGEEAADGASVCKRMHPLHCEVRPPVGARRLRLVPEFAVGAIWQPLVAQHIVVVQGEQRMPMLPMGVHRLRPHVRQRDFQEGRPEERSVRAPRKAQGHTEVACDELPQPHSHTEFPQPWDDGSDEVLRVPGGTRAFPEGHRSSFAAVLDVEVAMFLHQRASEAGEAVERRRQRGLEALAIQARGEEVRGPHLSPRHVDVNVGAGRQPADAPTGPWLHEGGALGNPSGEPSSQSEKLLRRPQKEAVPNRKGRGDRAQAVTLLSHAGQVEGREGGPLLGQEASQAAQSGTIDDERPWELDVIPLLDFVPQLHPAQRV